jgi:DNA-binding transcriptional LysR family regulator
MNNKNWQWWQYFLAIAEYGSLSRASTTLGVSQPTLSRQLQSMENRLGQPLFDRSTQGLSLTVFGKSLLEDCRKMQTSADRLERIAAGHSSTLTGRVRLAANELIAQYYLPKILPLFQDSYPELSIEVVVSNSASNLDKRDADIAIRMFKPTQLDLVCRKLMDIPLGFYASAEYLDRRGTPKTAEQLFSHRIIGFDRDTQFEKGGQEMGWNIKNEQFLIRTDFMPMHLELARHHGGIVASHKRLCVDMGLTEVTLDTDLPKLPIYLACHRDVQHNKKIRVLMDFLGQHLLSE